MSAWIVSENHISALVWGLKHWGVVEPDADDAEVAITLWSENHTSVNARYREHTPTPDYTYRAPDIETRTPAVMLKLAQCYEYQSCEHDAWELSTPCAWVGLLQDLIEHDFTDLQRTLAYSSAPWGIP